MEAAQRRNVKVKIFPDSSGRKNFIIALQPHGELKESRWHCGFSGGQL